MKRENMHRLIIILLVTLSIQAFSQTTLMDSVSQYGITWKFSKPTPVGRFVNGDYYVVGQCTITSITPAPTVSPARHGSQLNLHVNNKYYTNGKVGWDDRVPYGRYEASYRVYPPIVLSPDNNNTLFSSISVDGMGSGELKEMFREDYTDTENSTRIIAVLTCLDEAVDADAFRPGYADPAKKIYYAHNLRKELLPGLTKPATIKYSLSQLSAYMEKPWVEVGYDNFTTAGLNMPRYGREYARLTAHAALMLCLNYPISEKDTLLIRMVQLGIDLWGLLEAGYNGWPAQGGHGQGRKLPLLFAGLMLNDSNMMSPNTKHPNVNFPEDIQTMYDDCWTGANVVFAGHAGADGATQAHPDWGAYEHLNPCQWPGTTGESYRRCCTSIAWVGEATAAKLLGLQQTWNHNAFFDYVDRWMTEDDTPFLAIIKSCTGHDYSASWSIQGQAWDKFVEQMYWQAVDVTSFTSNFSNKIVLSQNYPNPFNLKTNISYSLSETGYVSLKIIDIYGREVTTLVNEVQTAGVHNVEWNRMDSEGQKVSGGIYLCQFRGAFGFMCTKKLILLN